MSPFSPALFFRSLFGKGPRNPSPPSAALAEARPGDGPEPDHRFALALYRHLAEAAPKENLAVSPASVSLALAMAYAGAAGETKAQMARTAGFDQDAQANSARFGSLRAAWAASGAGCRISAANRVWVAEGLPVREAFDRTMSERFGAGLARADFARNASKARGQINAWVAEMTAGMIRDLLPPSAIDAETALVLVNAIHLKALWEKPFDPSCTRDEPFRLLDGGRAQAPMMGQSGTFRYAEFKGPNVQALEMPFKGRSGASMLVLLPDSPRSLAKLEASLDADSLAAWIGALRKRRANVGLPRFKARRKQELGAALSALGMPLAFGAGAEFPGVFEDRGAPISRAIHEAAVEIDEEGAEAAAATAMVARSMAAPEPPAEFKADRPFLFLIRDGAGNILFIGRVANPAAP